MERSPGEGKGYPLQYFGLENSMDCTVLGVAKRYFHTGFSGDAGGKESTCQCRRHREGKRFGFSSWSGKIPWRRKWYLTPVFLPGESHRQRSLVDSNPVGHKASDTTEVHKPWVYSPYYKHALVAYCIHNSLYCLILLPLNCPLVHFSSVLNCV